MLCWLVGVIFVDESGDWLAVFARTSNPLDERGDVVGNKIKEDER